MVKERNYLIETLKSSGIKSQVYTNMKKLKAGNEVHVGAVLRNGETFARSGSKKTYIDQEGQRKRRVKLWDRSTSLHVVIADTSEEKVEEMSKRDYIDAGSIQTTVNFDGHIYHIRIAFRRTDSNSEYNIDIESNGVEVIVE